MEFEVRMDFSGPLFKIGGPGLEREMNKAVTELIQMGEERIVEMARPQSAGEFLRAGMVGAGGTVVTREKESKGNYRKNLSTTPSKNFNAKIFQPVKYAHWLEGTGSRNRTTRFKGYFIFRQTKDWLNTKSTDIFNAYARRFAKRMNT
jgi:hypothetical protein